MKKPFFIATFFGIAVVAGIALYIVNKKDKLEKTEENDLIANEPKSDIHTVSYLDLHEQKVDVASAISERHNVAAQIIRETLNEENTDIGESEHKVDFDEIDSSLDGLLYEE